MARTRFKGTPTERELNSMWSKQIIRGDTMAKDAYDLSPIFKEAFPDWQKFKNNYNTWRNNKTAEIEMARNPTGKPAGMLHVLCTFTRLHVALAQFAHTHAHAGPVISFQML